ncbi:uncharacterized protein ATNIH1004_008464 [Aspergillus tanneri]|uniref:Uncharacterized protein n=1 Tax=Aspergillus tanneri TaxID=1220188 RepID=A0A5M9MB27_9EURO|nr:uncharacterized protein ATNIH1004_008464 [Aspergillus tanneri]KAA8644265.1 hypothetical protein ATNIH1004_008464 [Aspergillus tanneri]
MPLIDLGSDSSSNSSSDSGSSGSSSRSNSGSRQHDQWEAAMRGASLPDSLACETARCAVIRGIRCYYEFATSNAVKEACTIYSNVYPEFTRARNARLIMSN